MKSNQDQANNDQHRQQQKWNAHFQQDGDKMGDYPCQKVTCRSRTWQYDQRTAEYIFQTNAAGHGRHWVQAILWRHRKPRSRSNAQAAIHINSQAGQILMIQSIGTSNFSTFWNFSSGLLRTSISGVIAQADTGVATPTLSNNCGTMQGFPILEYVNIPESGIRAGMTSLHSTVMYSAKLSSPLFPSQRRMTVIYSMEQKIYCKPCFQ